jgi:2-polyprenyl-6-hydroxyphenyl methylase/3-demethylubiquinone-9 3-methyltransferase
VEEIVRNPLLPDLGRLRDRRLLDLFDRFGGVAPRSRVLEIGCGRSRWLPFLARERGLEVSGVDIEPFAAELASANLLACGAAGEILCRDAFALSRNEDLLDRFDLVYSTGVMEHFDDVVDRLAVLARYLRPGGRILTTVPNLHGVNWALQRLADRETLEMHVVYDPARLQRAHESAGFLTIASGYRGFFDGYLSSAGRAPAGPRRRLHGWLCRAGGMAGEAWLRTGRGAITPETRWLSPHVFFVGARLQYRARSSKTLRAPS